ncbi:ADP-ribose pyrophosphatase YjhB, NUDIX family [Amycolatopsis pretoriensis]|uniref:ADP-ribose pyrophosphatase YjhB, NUDIX family n=1 Tax=Amycolatopsis pretoriensis TaxID=218821 RepID=A0A1H5QDU5_9PSEU|nr:NUDIX hydrolase [Amycolatopsis pretoriensis]SEF24255.1 ADP-ribose pyrophosphatase YjhB, NUDIX family [Amycolatopsis pretoriensis]
MVNSSPGLYLAGAFAFLFYNRRFLVLEERPEKKKYDLDLPGGTLEPSEDPVAGLRREVREETGLEIAEAFPLCYLKYDQHESGRSILVGFYIGTASSSDVTISKEHVGYRWITREEFENSPMTVSLDKKYVVELLDAYPAVTT